MSNVCVKKRTKAGKIIGWVFAGIAIAIVVAVVFGYFIKYLWLKTLVPMFGFPEISYWQAVGLVILARLLFGSIGGSDHDQHDHSKKEDDWEKKFEKKCEEYFTCETPEFGPGHKDFMTYWKKDGEAAFKTFLDTQNAGKSDEDKAEGEST